MRKRLWGILWGLVSMSVPLVAQTVSNVQFSQTGEDKVTITYSLSDDAEKVELMISWDGGKTWSRPLTACMGNIGKNISTGYNRIIWSPLEEGMDVVGDKICFKVQPYTLSVVHMPKIKIPKTKIPKSHPRLDSFYADYGKIELGWLQYDLFIGSNLGMQASILNLRTGIAEWQLLGFGWQWKWKKRTFDDDESHDDEFKYYSKFNMFYWQANVRFYIPMRNGHSCFFIDAGPRYEIEMERYKPKHYYYRLKGFFVGADAGFRLNGQVCSWDFFFRYNRGYVGGIALNFHSHWKPKRYE